MSLSINEKKARGPEIKVIGVGGGGCNALEEMISSGSSGISFIAANTDAQALRGSSGGMRIQLGESLTRGLGAGGNPATAREAAESDSEKIRELVSGSDILFIAAGFGGGTGTGAAPVIARESRSMGILTVGVVTRPFRFEGRKKEKRAQAGIEELSRYSDTLLVIPNQKIFSIINREASSLEAFRKADEVLSRAVSSISDILSKTGRKTLVNVDFADIRGIMQDSGNAILGLGSGSGEGRALDAVTEAVTSPLLDDLSIAGARGLIVNIRGPANLGFREVKQAMEYIKESVAPDAEIYFGLVTDERMNPEDLKVAVIATGCMKREEQLYFRNFRSIKPPEKKAPEKFPAYLRKHRFPRTRGQEGESGK